MGGHPGGERSCGGEVAVEELTNHGPGARKGTLAAGEVGEASAEAVEDAEAVSDDAWRLRAHAQGNKEGPELSSGGVMYPSGGDPASARKQGAVTSDDNNPEARAPSEAAGFVEEAAVDEPCDLAMVRPQDG